MHLPQDNLMTPEERRELIERLASEVSELVLPIDFDGLERKGIISKEGAWYIAHDYNNLPDHVSAKIKILS